MTTNDHSFQFFHRTGVSVGPTVPRQHHLNYFLRYVQGVAVVLPRLRDTAHYRVTEYGRV